MFNLAEKKNFEKNLPFKVYGNLKTARKAKERES